MSTSRNEITTVDLEAMVLDKRPKAVRLQIAIWLPLRLVESFTYDDGQTSDEPRVGRWIKKLRIPWWLAKEKGLVESDRNTGGAGGWGRR